MDHPPGNIVSLLTSLAIVLASQQARAQDAIAAGDRDGDPRSADTRVDGDVDAPVVRDARPRVLLEGTGAYGVQFGTTEYLPSGAPGTYQHPLVHGWAVGATAGIELDPAIALVANYEYASAMSSHGSLEGVLDDVQGEIDYHTIVGGVRLFAPLGPGGLQAELAGGVVLPFETELRVTYGPALGQLPTPITGVGTQIERYSVGFGGHGLVGYRVHLGDVLYLAANVKLRLFESENSGETTELRNFVTDYAAPSATDATIAHGEGAAAPSTYSVQDVRMQLAIGARI